MAGEAEMKHRIGNTPKCKDCRWYMEKEGYDGCRLDGWCTNKKQCSLGINGKRREHPPEKEPVLWNHCCRLWEDAECGLTHFEVCTRKPEPWRTAKEQEEVRRLLDE